MLQSKGCLALLHVFATVKRLQCTTSADSLNFSQMIDMRSRQHRQDARKAASWDHRQGSQQWRQRQQNSSDSVAPYTPASMLARQQMLNDRQVADSTASSSAERCRAALQVRSKAAAMRPESTVSSRSGDWQLSSINSYGVLATEGNGDTKSTTEPYPM